MKTTSRRRAPWMRPLVLALVHLCYGSVTLATEPSTVSGFFCTEFDPVTRLGVAITATDTALYRIGVSTWNPVRAPQTLDDQPPTTVAELARSLEENRSLFLVTHGAFGGEFFIGPYLTSAGARIQAAIDSAAGFHTVTVAAPQHGAYWLKIPPSLTADTLSRAVRKEAILFALGCYGSHWAGHFFGLLPQITTSPRSGNKEGPSYVGYPGTIWSDNLLDSYDFLIASLTCLCKKVRYSSIASLVPFEPFARDEDCRGLVPTDTWEFRGNRYNSLAQGVDCANVVSSLALRPPLSPASRTDGLGMTPCPEDGSAHNRPWASATHQQPGNQAFPALTPAALSPDPFRDRTQSSVSHLRSRASLPHPPLSTGNRAAPPNEKVLEPQCPLCADVIIYSSSAAMANAAAHHFTYQDNGHGQNSEVRIIVGGVDPSSVTDALEETMVANFDFNEEHTTHRFPVHPGPVVVLVGDASPVVVRTPTMEDVREACGPWDCRTYFDLVDLTGDGVPEAPVQVIPAQTVQDVWDICDRAEEWNDGDWVEPSGSIGVFMDDWESGGPHPSYLSEAISIAGDYADAGIPSGGLNLASQFAPSNRCAAGADLINRGVRDLWVMGRQTSHDNWTQFMDGCNLGALTQKQRVVVFAPNCQTAAIWRGDALAEQFLLADSAGTAAAAVLGNLNGDYWRKHQIAGHVLREEYLSAAVGTPLSRILYDAVCRLGDLGYSHLARGMVMLGGHAVKRGESAPQGIVEPAAPWQRQGPRLWPTPWDGRGVLYLSNVDGCDAATVEVFNAAGAKVAEWDARADEQKRTERIVATSAAPDRPLASGVYFARISCGGVKTARTLLVVR